MARILLDAAEGFEDRALFAFERLQESPVVKHQHAGNLSLFVAHARAHQELFQMGG